MPLTSAMDTATVRPKSSAPGFKGLNVEPDAGETRTEGATLACGTGDDGRFGDDPAIHDSHEVTGLRGVGGPVSEIVEDEVLEQDDPGRSWFSAGTTLNAEGYIEECVFAGTNRVGVAGTGGSLGSDCDLLWPFRVSGSYIMLAARDIVLVETDWAATCLRGRGRGNGLERIFNSSLLHITRSGSSSLTISTCSCDSAL